MISFLEGEAAENHIQLTKKSSKQTKKPPESSPPSDGFIIIKIFT